MKQSVVACFAIVIIVTSLSGCLNGKSVRNDKVVSILQSLDARANHLDSYRLVYDVTVSTAKYALGRPELSNRVDYYTTKAKVQDSKWSGGKKSEVEIQEDYSVAKVTRIGINKTGLEIVCTLVSGSASCEKVEPGKSQIGFNADYELAIAKQGTVKLLGQVNAAGSPCYRLKYTVSNNHSGITDRFKPHLNDVIINGVGLYISDFDVCLDKEFGYLRSLKIETWDLTEIKKRTNPLQIVALHITEENNELDTDTYPLPFALTQLQCSNASATFVITPLNDSDLQLNLSFDGTELSSISENMSGLVEKEITIPFKSLIKSITEEEEVKEKENNTLYAEVSSEHYGKACNRDFCSTQRCSVKESIMKLEELEEK